MSSQQSSNSGNVAPGLREMRQRASDRLGRWVNQKYRLDSMLGVGGMATVYAATHRNGSRVALKILHTEFAAEEAIKQRFLREGYVANKVDHHGRVAILDDDETEQHEPFLVMELLEGETLQQLWKRHDRRVPVLDALRVAEAVLDTLIPFHEQRIIHRDLKPANIFITHDGLVKLLDFGVAQMREQGGEALTRAGTALGTPSFMSPEQAMGKSDQLDGRADLFSVGALLYAILCGKRLHQGKSDNEAFILAATQPAPSLARSAPQLPVEVIAFVDRALAWDRRKRFPDATSMRDVCRELMRTLSERNREPRASVLPGKLSMPPTAVASPAAVRTEPAAVRAEPAPAAVRAEPARRAEPAPPPAPRPEPTPRPPPIAPQRPEPQRVEPPSTRTRAQPARETSIELDRRSSRPPPLGEQPVEGGVLELFKRLEKAFPALKHYGGDHPESLAKVRAVYRAIVELLRDEPEGLRWEVHPFCFTRDGATVWEPGPPLDQLPYNLASAGVERVHIRTGVTEEEVHAFLRAVIIEPQLAGDETDIGAELWEAGLTHIVCSIRDDFGANDARAQVRFFDEADELEQELREELAELAEMLAGTAKPMLDREGEAEMAALAIASDKSSFKALGEATTALWIEPAMKTALSSQMNLDPEEWRERFLDVVIVGLDDAVARGDGEVVLGALRLFAFQLASRSSWRELLDTHTELVDRLMASHPDDGGLAITRAMFPWEVVERAFEDARSGANEAASVATQALRGALPRLDAALLKPMLTLADDLRDERLRELAFSYFDVAIADNEETVVDMLDDLGPDLAQRMLASVAASAGDTANELLRPLLLSNNPAVRCEAAALLSSSAEQLGKQLLRMLDSNDATLRAAALGTMLRHQVKSVGPALVQLVEAEGFSARPPTEQRQIFETLYALHPSRAERLLTGIIEQHGMLPDDTLDRVRASAAEVLGRLGDSSEALEALENAARRRPWNTQMVRSTATAAIEAIKRRLGGGVARRVEP